MQSKIFETVSFHLVKSCDYQCKFCYATYNDFKVDKTLTISECSVILERLKSAGVQKVTFAGGEPFLFQHLKNVIWIAKEMGFTTSIISNGGMITAGWLKDMGDSLDWVGISVDSLDRSTNIKIGRERDNTKQTDYRWLIQEINDFGYKLKINTVVNRFNEDESMQEFIDFANPQRWKIFDTLKVLGQNDKQFDSIKSSEGGFKRFVNRHHHPNMVPEDNQAMTGSYMLIDPRGRMYENWGGEHNYSDSLAYNTIEHCLSQIRLDRAMFEKRGGIYQW